MDPIGIGSRVMFALGIYTIVISMLWVTITETMFVSDFAAYTGQNISQYREASPKAADMYIITKKLVGMELLLAGVVMALISHNAYSKGETWSWYALLISGLLTWVLFIAYRVLIGYWASVGLVPFLIGTALFMIGMGIPAKAILGKGSAGAL
jgi:hypothetical protein